MHPLQFAPNDRDIKDERNTNCREMNDFVVLVFIFEQMADVVVDNSNTVNSNMNIVYNVNNQSSLIRMYLFDTTFDLLIALLHVSFHYL